MTPIACHWDEEAIRVVDGWWRNGGARREDERGPAMLATRGDGERGKLGLAGDTGLKIALGLLATHGQRS